jgi:hypothetical protein
MRGRLTQVPFLARDLGLGIGDRESCEDRYNAGTLLEQQERDFLSDLLSTHAFGHIYIAHMICADHQ